MTEHHDAERARPAERGLADRQAPWRSGNGVVCGWAVRWRELTLARGLDRVAAELEREEERRGIRW